MVDISVIDSSAQILTGGKKDYDALLELIGDARFVLLGEASHGTQEFYHERALITQRLISEKGFSAIAIEGDWPDAYRVNRFICKQSADRTADEALAGFERFPTWMWRNTEVMKFVDWLRDFNDTRIQPLHKVGFYGLDLYSLFTSIDEVIQYLDKVDPLAARKARSDYACFDHFERNSQLYGYVLSMYGASHSCEDGVVAQLLELYKQAEKYLQHDGADATDALFYAQQNARLIKNAEQYYRNMFNHKISSWNMRDRHMAEILESLDQHLSAKQNSPAKIVVWAHNSHLGDARATQMGEQGELNVGQLMREAHGNEAVLVGFTTHHGHVTAASDWGAPAERKKIKPALHSSYEDYFHQTGISSFYLPIRGNYLLQETLSFEQHLERAIGVIYLPQTERQSHYFYADLTKQFDAIIHIDETHALKPLELTSHWVGGEAPETYPVGL
jgi:erythromycin esterase-like protein